MLEEEIKPRANLPPLLVHVSERHPEKLHYLGVSFGLTLDLFRFWRKNNFIPFYVTHIPSYVTGEHTCMVLKPLNNDDIEADEYGFVAPFYQDFRQRFSQLLCTTFCSLNYELAMSILAPKIDFNEHEPLSAATDEKVKSSGDVLSPYDMKRLEAYTNNYVDYHMIIDLVPMLAQQYFQEKLPVTLSPVQASILFCMGMQKQDITYIKEEMKLEREHISSNFIKVMKKLYNCLYNIATKEIDSRLTSRLTRFNEVILAPHSVSVDEDLDQAAREVMEEMKAENNVTFDPEYLQQYAILDNEDGFDKALQNGAGKVLASGLISVKSSRPKMDKHKKHKEMSKNKRKWRNDGNRLMSNKKKRP